MMLRPRFLARFLAWLGGYFWIPCPLCGRYFAGFEWTSDQYSSDITFVRHEPVVGIDPASDSDTIVRTVTVEAFVPGTSKLESITVLYGEDEDEGLEWAYEQAEHALRMRLFVRPSTIPHPAGSGGIAICPVCTAEGRGRRS
jgi:hypothetical protein